MPQVVLYIEDDPNDVFLMERAFQQSVPNLDLKVLTNGTEATDFLNSSDGASKSPMKPAIILLDIHLPGKSGLELLPEVRAMNGFKHVPVIMFSSSNQASDIEKAYARGCSGYVVKPQGTDKLKELVSRLTGFWLKDNRYP